MDDPDPRVRLQLAFTLGEWTNPESGEALAQLLNRPDHDPFLTAAVFSSALPHLDRLAEAATPATRSSLLPMALAAENRTALSRLLAPAFDFGDDARAERWKGFGTFLDEARTRQLQLDALQEAGGSDAFSQLLGQRDRLFAEASAGMDDDTFPLPGRLAAAALLSRHPPVREQAIAFLSGQLESQPHSEHWAEILSTLAATGEKSLPDLALKQWPQLSPHQRGLLLDTLMSRPIWASKLLAGVQSGNLSPADFDATRRMQLQFPAVTRIAPTSRKSPARCNPPRRRRYAGCLGDECAGCRFRWCHSHPSGDRRGQECAHNLHERGWRPWSLR